MTVPLQKKGSGQLLQSSGGGGSIGSGAAAMAKSFQGLDQIANQLAQWSSDLGAQRKDEELRRDLTAAQDLGRKHGTLYDPQGRLQHLGKGHDLTGKFNDARVAEAYRESLFTSHGSAAIAQFKADSEALRAKHKTDPDSYQTASEKLLEGMLSVVPESFYNYLEPRLRDIQSSTHTNINTQLSELREEEIKKNLTVAEETSRNTALNYALNGHHGSDSQRMASADYVSSIEAQVKAGHKTPDEGAQDIRELNHALGAAHNQYRLATAFNERGIDAAIGVLTEIQSADYGDYDPKVVRAIKAEAERFLNASIKRKAGRAKEKEREIKARQDENFTSLILEVRQGEVFSESLLQKMYRLGTISFQQYKEASNTNTTQVNEVRESLIKNQNAVISLDVGVGNFESFDRAVEKMQGGDPEWSISRLEPLIKQARKKRKEIFDAAVKANNKDFHAWRIKTNIEMQITPAEAAQIVENRGKFATKDDYSWLKTYTNEYKTAQKTRAKEIAIAHDIHSGRRISGSKFTTYMDGNYPAGLSARNQDDHSKIALVHKETKNLPETVTADFKSVSNEITYSPEFKATLDLFKTLQSRTNDSNQVSLRETLGDKLYAKLEWIAKNFKAPDDPEEAQNALDDFRKTIRPIDNTSGNRKKAAWGLNTDDPNAIRLWAQTGVAGAMERSTGLLASFTERSNLLNKSVQAVASEYDPYFGNNRWPDELPPRMIDAADQIAQSFVENGVYEKEAEDEMFTAVLMELYRQGWRPQEKYDVNEEFGAEEIVSLPFVDVLAYPFQQEGDFRSRFNGEYEWVQNGIVAAAKVTLPPALRAGGYTIGMDQVQGHTRKWVQQISPDVDVSNTTFRYKIIPGTENEAEWIAEPFAGEEGEAGGVEYADVRQVPLPWYTVEMMTEDGQWRELRLPNGNAAPYRFNWSDTHGPNAYLKGIERVKNSWMSPFITSRLTDLVGISAGSVVADQVKMSDQAFAGTTDLLDFGEDLNKLLKLTGSPEMDLSEIKPENILSTDQFLTSATQTGYKAPTDIALAIEMTYLRLLGNAGITFAKHQIDRAWETIEEGLGDSFPFVHKKEAPITPPVKTPPKKLPVISGNAKSNLLTPKGRGAEIVKAAASRVDEVLGGGEWLEQIAMVESDKGKNPETFERISQGIWQVDPIGFKDTQQLRGNNRDKRMREAWAKVEENFGIVWADVKHEELDKPLYGAIAARLFLIQNYGTEVPKSLEERANAWKKHYNKSGAGTPEYYIKKIRGR